MTFQMIFMTMLYLIIGVALCVVFVWLPFNLIKRKKKTGQYEERLKRFGFAPCPEHEDYLRQMTSYVSGNSEKDYSIIEPRICEIGKNRLYMFGLNETNAKIIDEWKVAFLIPFKPAIAKQTQLTLLKCAADGSNESQLDNITLDKLYLGADVGVETIRIFQAHAMLTLNPKNWLDNMDHVYSYLKTISAVG